MIKFNYQPQSCLLEESEALPQSAWEHQLGKNVLFWTSAQLIRGNKLFLSSVLTVCSHVVSK